MRLLRGLITGGGVGAFFFFSWILQLLWNSILVNQLGLVNVTLNYWQAAALWFMVIILFAWAGIAASPRALAKWRKYN